MRKTILALLLSTVACTYQTHDMSQFNNPCLNQHPPTVCIDPKSNHPSQDPLHVHGGDTAHFFISDGDGTLTITYDPSPAINSIGHEGAHVWVKTNPVKEVVHVKYAISINGRRMDPEMVIEP